LTFWIYFSILYQPQNLLQISHIIDHLQESIMGKLGISIIIITAACLLVLAFVLATCSNGLTDLPIETIGFELHEDGFYQFYTNDPDYLGKARGIIFDNDHPNTYEIECKKISGSRWYSYGMLFGHHETDITKYYIIMITVDGYYFIGKNNNTKWTDITKGDEGWVYSNNLKKNYNKMNSIKITKTESLYEIYFNGKKEMQFSDKDYFGDKYGFFASIGEIDEENFPNKPVDIRFWLK